MCHPYCSEPARWKCSQAAAEEINQTSRACRETRHRPSVQRGDLVTVQAPHRRTVVIDCDGVTYCGLWALECASCEHLTILF